MFNGGTRKRMLAAAVGSHNHGIISGIRHHEAAHRPSSTARLHEQSHVHQKPNTPPCTGLPHSAAAAAAAVAVAGRATLAAARAACAAACVAQASSSSNGKGDSPEDEYDGLHEISHRSQRNKVRPLYSYI